MIVAGVSVSFIIGTVITWRTLALTGENWILNLIRDSVNTNMQLEKITTIDNDK